MTAQDRDGAHKQACDLWTELNSLCEQRLGMKALDRIAAALATVREEERERYREMMRLLKTMFNDDTVALITIEEVIDEAIREGGAVQKPMIDLDERGYL